jgi:hypothetical protein
MKWWLKLYTIPFIIYFSKWILVILALDLGASVYLEWAQPAIIFFYLTPLIFSFKNSKNHGFRANLEFHKLSINLQDLKKAFFLDFIFSFLLLVVVALFAISISSTAGAAFSYMKNLSFTFKAVCLLGLFLFMLYLNFFSKNKSDNEKYVLYQSESLVLKLLKMFVLLNLVVFYPLALFYIGIDQGFVPYLLLYIFIVIHILFLSRALFNQTPPKASLFVFLKFTGAGTALSLSLFFLLAFIFRNEFKDQSLSVEDRVQSFMTWQPMSGTLTASEFMIFDKHMRGYDARRLIGKIDKEELNSIPFSYFLFNQDNLQLNPLYSKHQVGLRGRIQPPPISRHQISSLRFSFYLGTGKVNVENLTMLLDFLTFNDFGSEAFFQKELIMRVLKAWPKGAPFPERHLAAKLSYDELVAKNKLSNISDEED